MYELLKEQTKDEYKKQLESTIEDLNNNVDTWTQENVMKYYLTDLRKQQLEDGEITKTKAIEIATKKATKENTKRLENVLKHIENVEQAIETNEIHIIVEWKTYNRTYGNKNASAKIYVKGSGTFYGHAGGYGYDKESSAIANAFNQSNSALKILYNMKENALKTDKNATNESACGYGAGYGATPYFAGGVGVNCFIWILKSAGFTCTETHSKSTDVYIFTK